MVTPHAHATASAGRDAINRYVAAVPPGRRGALDRLVSDVREHIDPRFDETTDSGMPSWVVPHRIYPSGYHVDPALGLPFLSIANQKNYIAVYHMGVYSDPATLDWFIEQYARTGLRLNMGRSCIRFTNVERIPFELMAELTRRIDVDEFVRLYEKALAR